MSASIFLAKAGNPAYWQGPQLSLDRRGGRCINILLDDDFINKISMRFLASRWINTGPEILVSTAFMTIPRALREAGIWHEVGHIHHEHHLRGKFCDAAQLRAARIMAVETGNVDCPRSKPTASPYYNW